MNTKPSILKLVDDTAFFPTSCEEQMHIVQLMTVELSAFDTVLRGKSA